jgi:hypothetical protein
MITLLSVATLWLAASQEPPKPVVKKLETGLKLELPEAWKEGKVESKMRLAQFALKPKDKNSKLGEAELVVFHFGPQGGGSNDANIDRWVGQFEGKKRADAKVEKLDGKIEGVLVDLTGTYVAPVRPGAEEKLHQPDTRMLAAILQTPKGAHYLKLVGPKKTVSDWEGEFRDMVKRATVEPPK